MARPKRKGGAVQRQTAPETPKQRVYNAGGYIRLSVEDSGHPGAETIEMQRSMVLSYIEAQPDMRFCELFCDNGRTGTNFERPGFEALMEKVRTGKIDCIVVKDLSRFGRNYLEADNYLERIFPFLDVRFVAINDHYDTLTAARSNDGLLVSLKNVVNSAYSKDISKKSSSALTTKRQKGEFIGAFAPYGYRKSPADNHKLEINEETAPIVRMIFQWRRSGTSLLQIVRQLNSQGIPSPARYHYLQGELKSERLANSQWHSAMVKKLLSNQAYLGHMVQGKSRNNFAVGKKMCACPESEWIIVPNTHEPIIDEETFRIVQEMREKCRATFQERAGKFDSLGKIPNILHGLVFCSDCKRPMIRYKNVSEKCGHRYYSFICLTHSEDPASCPKKNLRETELIEILWDTLQREIALAEEVEKLVRQHSHSPKVKSLEDAMRREIAAAQQARDRAEMLHDSLYQNYIDHLMAEKEYMEMKGQYKADMARAQEQLENAAQRLQESKDRAEHNPWLTSFGQYRGEAELTDAMAHALIERIEVDAENHVSIVLRYRDAYKSLVHMLEDGGEAVPV